MDPRYAADVEEFMKGLRHRNAGQPEFQQAAEEVVIALMPTVKQNPQFQKAKILERVSESDRIISFRVTWEDDKGEIHVNRGYRVQWNSAIGPYKGGIRFHPTVNLSILKFLAFEQTFKNSLTGLPMGGGKGGSDFDPKGKSDSEIMRFCQSFMTELFRHIGADTDVPAGDIGVGGREVGYMFGQYKRLVNRFEGVLTGKGLSYGGSLIRPEATGYGVVYFMEDMLAHRGEAIAGRTCAVSGSGNVAQYTVEKINDLGGKVVTLSDSSGFIYDKAGIDAHRLAWLLDLKNVRRGRIEEYAKEFGCEFHADKRPWGVPVELAFPCATQNELDEEDAKTLIKNGVKAVSEGANMPTLPAAVEAFLHAGIPNAPSKASNAGGVATSGLEMSQNSLRISWSRHEVDSRLREIMRNIHAQCVEHGTKDGKTDYYSGANVAGFVKVANAMLAQGVM